VTADDGVATVKCSGRLVAGVTDILYNEVHPLTRRVKRIVLDLTDVTKMDSMGLGTLARLYVSAKTAGCQLQLINLSKRVRELLGMTNMLRVFEICGEEHIRM
jgi:anti-sigma B factor antagonist